MANSFSFNFNSNLTIGGKKKHRVTTSASDKQDLTPQQEYWLNRFLRQYAGKIYFLIILFFVLMFGVVIFGNSNNSSSNSIEFRTSISK